MRTISVDRVMAEARAASFTQRSIKEDAKLQGLCMALSMIDLTTLEGKDSRERIAALCHKAALPASDMPDLPRVGAVCVYPNHVALADRLLDGTGIHIASVATAFPSGQSPLELRLEGVRKVVGFGADEVDMVINRGAFLAGDYTTMQMEIEAIKEASGPAHLKVILETGELETLDKIRLASDLAIEAGADFIKTSTGKIQPAATMPVVLVMMEAVRDHFLATGKRVGMKPAGGISKAKQALHYLVMVKETLGDDWLTPDLFRFGASSLANDIIRQIRWKRTGNYTASYDVSIG